MSVSVTDNDAVHEPDDVVAQATTDGELDREDVAAQRADAGYRALPSASPRYLQMDRMSRAELELIFTRGLTPELEALVGWEFRGMNTAAWAYAVGIKKFVKGFYRPGGSDDVYGYNCPVVQDGLQRPWRTKPSDESPKRFGFYRVQAVDAASRDNAHLHAVLLDYNQGQNPRMDPSRGIRDYLVQVDADDSDLYLGKAYFALGAVRVPVGFFVLERMRRGPSDPNF